ncbi:MAG TPA: nicotinamide riboside transporter PnuC [Gemmatimonadaceae bacterium]|nr:nicotinamide riboside transporter PnuC [Gemmatimonadaceae bacterium]
MGRTAARSALDVVTGRDALFSTTMNPVEILAVAMTLFGIVLTIRQNILCWPVAIVGVLAYLFVFARARLYADAALQPIFVVQNIYGWWYWSQGGARGNDTTPVVTLTWAKRAGVAAITAAAAVLVGFGLARWTNAAAPYADATLSATSLTANLLLARKVVENWWLWIAVNIGYVVLFWRKNLTLSAALYVVLLGLAVAGLMEWRRAWEAQRARRPSTSTTTR